MNSGTKADRALSREAKALRSKFKRTVDRGSRSGASVNAGSVNGWHSSQGQQAARRPSHVAVLCAHDPPMDGPTSNARPKARSGQQRLRDGLLTSTSASSTTSALSADGHRARAARWGQNNEGAYGQNLGVVSRRSVSRGKATSARARGTAGGRWCVPPERARARASPARRTKTTSARTRGTAAGRRCAPRCNGHDRGFTLRAKTTSARARGTAVGRWCLPRSPSSERVRSQGRAAITTT